MNDNRPEVVKILIEAGLNVDKVDVRGNKPLHYAVTQDFDDVANLLPSDQNKETCFFVYDNLLQFEEIFEDASLGIR